MFCAYPTTRFYELNCEREHEATIAKKLEIQRVGLGLALRECGRHRNFGHETEYQPTTVRIRTIQTAYQLDSCVGDLGLHRVNTEQFDRLAKFVRETVTEVGAKNDWELGLGLA